MKSGIFFDRDGIINELIVEQGKIRPPWKKSEIKIVEDVVNTVNKLKKTYLVFIISNQPDYARGHVSKKNLIDINSFILNKFNFDDYQIDFTDDPEFKKPSPFMIFELSKKHNINLLNSWVIGDRWSDISAGNKAGCKTILLEKTYSQNRNKDGSFDKVVPNFKIKKIKDIEKILL